MKKISLSVVLSLIFVFSVLLAACNKVEFKIEFIVDGSLYETINTNGNETIKMPTDPTKDGFDFDGWYWDNNSWQRPFTANSLLNEPLSENMKVYAKWNDKNSLEGTQAKFNGFTEVSANTYSITVSNVMETLNFSDIVEVSNKSVWTLNLDISATQSIPSKIATLSAGDNTYYVLVTAENSNVKLYTLQIRRKPLYLVTFNTVDGTTVNSQNIEEDSFATTPTQPTKTGYSFINWDFDFNTAITEPIAVTANWQANTYKINYFANDESESKQEQNAVFNSSVNLYGNTTFTKTAYDLARWNTQADGQGTNYTCGFNISDYNIDGNLDLYVIWLPTIYNITYHLDNGTNGNNPQTYNIESATFTLLETEKDGYRFDGWYKESGFVNEVTQIENGSYGHLDLYAKFTKIAYQVIYNSNYGANSQITQNATFDLNLTLHGNTLFERLGYNLIGWNTLSNGQGTNYALSYNFTPYNAYGDLELFAVWEVITYDITYYLDNGINGANPLNYTVETNTITLHDASKTGYTFNGWYSENTFSNKITSIPKGSTGEVKLYAKFAPTPYSITYHLDNGTNGNNPIGYDIKTATIILDEASKAGYIFNGWYKENSFINKIEQITIGSYGNIELYAEFIIIPYTITYHLDNGDNGDNPISYTIETDTIILNEASKAGYRFDGWYKEATFITIVEQITKGNYEDKILYAKFTVIPYTITYYLDNGTNGNNLITYTVESNTIVLNDASKTGYDFNGWYKEIASINKVEQITKGSVGNVELYANFIATQYTITYILNNGTNGNNPIVYTIESDKIIFDDASKTGYTFNGWFCENSFENKVELIDSGSIGNVSLYAKFTPIVYTIIYHLDNGINGDNPNSYNIESDTFLLAAASKTSTSFMSNYSFLGWYLNDGYTKIEKIEKGQYGDLILYAKWTNSVQGTQANPYIILTKTHLIEFAGLINGGNKFAQSYFVLGANIDLGNMEWTPIGNSDICYFSGNFNANGFIITNFKITTQNIYTGLFGKNNGTISNLGVTSFTINVSLLNASLYAGGIAGSNSGAISGCYATGNVTANISTLGYEVSCGGLVGANSSTIRNCYATGIVKATASDGISYAGGLVGQNIYGKISNCYATGNVSASTPYVDVHVGGLVGRNYVSEITNCFATGNVTSTTFTMSTVGGLVGRQYDDTITNCYRYTSQSITGANKNSSGNTCTSTQLNSVSFYLDTIKWDSSVWDFSNLNFSSGKMPTLKA